MEVEAFLADSVQAGGGKLFALGVGWSVLSTAGFPARHDRVGIGIVVRLEPEERGHHELRLRFLDPKDRERPFGRAPDGEEIHELSAPFEVATDGGEGTATFALNVDGLTFEEPGAYTFVLRIDGEDVKRLRFRVQAPPAPPPTEYRGGAYI